MKSAFCRANPKYETSLVTAEQTRLSTWIGVHEQEAPIWIISSSSESRDDVLNSTIAIENYTLRPGATYQVSIRATAASLSRSASASPVQVFPPAL
jgi:hypothetical protein